MGSVHFKGILDTSHAENRRLNYFISNPAMFSNTTTALAITRFAQLNLIFKALHNRTFALSGTHPPMWSIAPDTLVEERVHRSSINDRIVNSCLA
jgi:hypothetical protein